MPIITIHDALNDIEKIDNDLSQGHVSVQEASDAVNHINTAWDNFADNCNSRLGIQLKNVVDNNTFEAFGGIKGGAATGINSVSSFLMQSIRLKVVGEIRQKQGENSKTVFMT